MRARPGGIAAAMVLAVGLACHEADRDQAVVTTIDDGSTTISPSSVHAASDGKSLVRLVNALPFRKAVVLMGDERAIQSGVGYEGVTGYTEVHGRFVAFRLLRESDDSVLAETRSVIVNGAHYTALAVPTGSGRVLLRLVRDDLTPADGKARVRIINAAPQVKDPDVALVGEDRKVLFKDVDFVSGEDFQDVAPTNATVEIRPGAKDARPVLLRNMFLAAGRAYTIVLAGSSANTVDTITFSDAMLDATTEFSSR